ncbi:MAG: redoxin domain-containing protein, partial [Pirellulales bacterium]
GHTGWVSALAVSPDGKHLVTGSMRHAQDQQGIPDDNSLRLWDVETGKEIRRFEDVLSAIRNVAFAPDGKSIVAGGENTMLGLWDVETGKCIRWFTAPTNVVSVAFSPDGTQVASSHVGGLKDGKWFDPEHSVIILWDVKTGREIRRLRGHTAVINSIAFSPDGRFIASLAGGGYFSDGWHDAEENTVRIWDVATGEELARAEVGTAVRSVAFTPDGRHVVTGGGRPGDPDPAADLRLWKLPQRLWPKDVTDVSPKPANATRPGPDETVSPEPSLGIGSPAPPLSVAQWISGESIDGFKPGQVYVVEFWATWCPPCRTSMPHLSQLQQQYGDDVKFVGVTREPEETVKKFLAKEQSPGKTWAEVVQYRLAIDSEDATNEAYMKAAQQSGIPTAFIVGRDAVVEWIGHPMSMDEPLAKIVAGDWDREAAIAQFQQRQKLKQRSRELSAKLRAEEWDDALDMLDQLEEESGKSQQLSRMRLSTLQKAGRSEEASRLQVEMVEQAWDSPMALNEIAWGIATSKGEGDLDLAFKAAQRASELQNHQDAATLDTLARVCYEKGQLDKAIEWQKKAVEQNQGNRAIDATLKKYEAEKALQPADVSP